jgi:hypothetical protein
LLLWRSFEFELLGFQDLRARFVRNIDRVAGDRCQLRKAEFRISTAHRRVAADCGKFDILRSIMGNNQESASGGESLKVPAKS